MQDELNEETQIQDSTTVEEVDVNLEEMFGQPGAESVMLPVEEVEPEEKKSNLFSKPEEIDTTFIDKTDTTSDNSPLETAKEVEEKVEALKEGIEVEIKEGEKVIKETIEEVK